MFEIIDRLVKYQDLKDEEFISLLNCTDVAAMEYLTHRAREVCDLNYGRKVYIRGLIEISSYCKNNCYYCGIRRGNTKAERYRLTKEEILDCCDHGWELGFRTFVMQGGEDNYYTDELMCEIIMEIKNRYPNCAVTLSLGERGEESFKRIMPVRTDTCYDTKRQIPSIIPNFTQGK